MKTDHKPINRETLGKKKNNVKKNCGKKYGNET